MERTEREYIPNRLTAKRIEFRKFKPFKPITTKEEWDRAFNLIPFELLMEEQIETEVLPMAKVTDILTEYAIKAALSPECMEEYATEAYEKLMGRPVPEEIKARLPEIIAKNMKKYVSFNPRPFEPGPFEPVYKSLVDELKEADDDQEEVR